VMDVTSGRGGSPGHNEDVQRNDADHHSEHGDDTGAGHTIGTQNVVSGDSSDVEDELDIDRVPESQVSGSPLNGSSQNYSVAQHSAQSSPRSGSRVHSPSISLSESNVLSQIHTLDKRFETRLGSMLSKMRPEPAQRSRHQIDTSLAIDELTLEAGQTTAWGAVRWTKLRKLSSQLYSDESSAKYGHPTVMVPASLILVGTTRGHVLAFDFHQNLTAILGNARSREWGEVTSLAMSADQTNVGVGYDSGHIAVWDLSRPFSPRIQIPPITKDSHENSELDGHMIGSPVVHLSFVSRRRSALYSGDLRGMVFLHDSTRVLLGRKVSTLRILGKYRAAVSVGSSSRKVSTILACSPQPIGVDSHQLGLVAIMTPYLLAIVSTVPRPRTHFKLPRNRRANYSMGLSASLAWFPSLKSQQDGRSIFNSRLAYCWSNVMEVIELVPVSSPGGDESVDLVRRKQLTYEEPFVAIFWFSRHVSRIPPPLDASFMSN
jgi:hypothetical protein